MTEIEFKKFRLLLLGDENEDGQDALITLIYEQCKARFLFYLHAAESKFGQPPSQEIPDACSWILEEMTAERFIRLGSEGYSSESVEGHSISFESSALSRWRSLIEDYARNKSGDRREGRVVIL